MYLITYFLFQDLTLQRKLRRAYLFCKDIKLIMENMKLGSLQEAHTICDDIYIYAQNVS